MRPRPPIIGPCSDSKEASASTRLFRTRETVWFNQCGSTTLNQTAFIIIYVRTTRYVSPLTLKPHSEAIQKTHSEARVSIPPHTRNCTRLAPCAPPALLAPCHGTYNPVSPSRTDHHRSWLRRTRATTRGSMDTYVRLGARFSQPPMFQFRVSPLARPHLAPSTCMSTLHAASHPSLSRLDASPFPEPVPGCHVSNSVFWSAMHVKPCRTVPDDADHRSVCVSATRNTAGVNRGGAHVAQPPRPPDGPSGTLGSG